MTDLLGRADEAALRAHQAINVARRMDNPIALSHALVARGIARLHGTSPDSIGSRQDFTAAQTNAPLLAGFNLALLNGTANEPIKQEIVPSTTPLSEVERIGGLAAMDYGKIDPKKVTQMPRDGPGQPAFSFYRQEKEYWTWLILDTGYNLIVFLETQAGYEGYGLGMNVLRLRKSMDQLAISYPVRRVYITYIRTLALFCDTEATNKWRNGYSSTSKSKGNAR